MFYEFASQYVYPEFEWSLIWKIETLIASVIRAHNEEVVDLPINKLMSSCLDWIRVLNLLDNAEYKKAEQYLEFQKESIFEYVKRNRQDFLRNKIRICLVPHFSEYLAASKQFSAHLKGRPILRKKY